jgi:hypothetical protein
MKLYNIFVVVLGLSTSIYSQTSVSQSTHNEPFYFGAVTDLGWRAANVDITNELLNDIGFNSYRTEMYWKNLELARNEYFFSSDKYGYNILDKYINSRKDRTPRRLSPAPMLTLDFDNPHKYPDGFEYGLMFPPTYKAINGFVNYAKAIAIRYADKIPLFEVWNEWNGGMGSGPRDAETGRYALSFGAPVCSDSHNEKYCWTPADAGGKDSMGRYRNQSATMPEYYLKLFVPTREAIKSVVPDAKVIAGVTSGLDWEWTHRFVQAGGWKLVKDDGFAVHPYFDGTAGHRYSPEESIGLLDVYQEDFRWWVHEQENIPFESVEDIPLYITEIGISTYKGGDYHGKLGRFRAAVDLIKYLFMARSRPYIKGVWIYQIQDREPVNLGRDGYELAIDGFDRERSYGLYYRNNPWGAPKLTALVLKRLKIAEHLIEGRDFVCTSDGNPCRRFGRDKNFKLYGVLGNVYKVTWKDRGGMKHTATWTRERDDITIDDDIINY